MDKDGSQIVQDVGGLELIRDRPLLEKTLDMRHRGVKDKRWDKIRL